MLWQWILMAMAGGVVWFAWNQRSLIRPPLAKQLLQQGAKLIDVRNPQEYESGHLPAAINVPLDELDWRVPREFPDPRTVLLLHCVSGMRCGIGQRQLRRLGYENAHNLGSYGRARRITAGSPNGPSLASGKKAREKSN